MINAAMIELSPGNEDAPVNDNQLLPRCDLEDRRFKFRDVLIFDDVFSVHAWVCMNLMLLQAVLADVFKPGDRGMVRFG